MGNGKAYLITYQRKKFCISKPAYQRIDLLRNKELRIAK